MEHVSLSIAEKMKFLTWLGGNGACTDLRKRECPHLLGWKWDMSGFHKRKISRCIWGEIEHVGFQKKCLA